VATVALFHDRTSATLRFDLQSTLSVKDRLGTLPTPNQLKYTAPGVEQNKVVSALSFFSAVQCPVVRVLASHVLHTSEGERKTWLTLMQTLFCEVLGRQRDLQSFQIQLVNNGCI